MEQKILRIQELLKKNIFLAEELRERIQNELPNLDEARADKILALLEKALSVEEEILSNAQKANPNFMAELNSAVGSSIKKDLVKREKVDRHEEEVELANLEAEINSIFE